MKNKKLQEGLFSLISGLFFGTLITFAALSAIVTAFSLHQVPQNNILYRPLSLVHLLWICIGFSLLFSLLFTVKRLWIFVPLIVIAVLGYGWHFGNLRDSVFDLLYIISKRYDNAYCCGVVLLKDKPVYSDLTSGFRGFAILGTALITWATCKGQSSYWILFFSLICFAPCCALTNTVPKSWVIFLWIFTLVLFLVTNYTRKSDPVKSTFLWLAYIVPLFAAVFLLFVLIPKSEYTGQEQADSLLQAFEDFFGFSGSSSGGGRTKSQAEVDLSNLEERKERNIPVMYVTAPESKTYYLRGEVYTTYTGFGWKTADIQDPLPWASSYPTREKFTIRTRFEHDMLYVPYCADPQILAEGDTILENSKELKEYSYYCYAPESSISLTATDSSAWTELPAETYEWASDFIRQKLMLPIAEDTFSLYYSPHYCAFTIEEYVRGTAVYDLAPEAMDPAYTDFAKWFAEEGESGYCVHFASTAAVLLRASGIPARYVTGYIVEAKADHEVTVYQRNSHAWVEYWTDDFGWQILEATPPRVEPTDGDTETEDNSESAETIPPTVESDTDPTENMSETTMPSTQNPTSDEDDIVSSDSSVRDHSASKTGAYFFRILKWLFIAGVIVVIIVVQRLLRIYFWFKKAEASPENQRALMYWSRCLRYSKVLGQAPDPKLQQIAEKAKFSQHDVTSKELGLFHKYFTQSQGNLKKQTIFRRIYGKFVLAL